jgi:hypothetical protein
LGNDLLRGIRPQTRDFRYPLHCLLVDPQQLRHFLVQFLDLFFHQLQFRQ